MIDVIILGGGKFAGNIVDDFSTQINPLGYLDNTSNTFLYEKYGVRFLGNDIKQFIGKHDICKNVVLCVGSEGDVRPRTRCFSEIKNLGFYLPTLIHESAIVSKRAVIGEGSIIQSHCVIQTNVRIGMDNVISANTFVGHDSLLEDHVFVGPGVNIGGSVVIKENAHLGIGAVILQKVCIGKNCIIGGSSCVICDVPDNSKVLGVPGKIMPR